MSDGDGPDSGFPWEAKAEDREAKSEDRGRLAAEDELKTGVREPPGGARQAATDVCEATTGVRESTTDVRDPSTDLRESTTAGRDPSTDTRVPPTAFSEPPPRCSRFRRHPIRYSILIIFAALALYLLIDYLRLPSVDDLEDLAKTRPKTTALMERRKSQSAEAGVPYKARAAWVPLSSISENLIHAVIITEDASFYAHNGIDWEELEISVKHDLEEGDRWRGASTITQQLAKNLFLDPTRSPMRKIREMIIARRMEDALSKSRILELYLNLIEWGPGVFGCELAARNNFGVSASELTREQAARLAAVIASPLKHRANGDDRFVTRRSTMILSRLDARGW